MDKKIKIVSTVESYALLSRVESIISPLYEMYEVEKEYKFRSGYSVIWYGDKDSLNIYHYELDKIGLTYSNFSGVLVKNGKSIQLRMEHITEKIK